MFAVLLTLSCAGVVRSTRSVPPEQAGTGVWERLGQLRSFAFTLRFHTDMPLPIEVKFSGAHEQADREVWSGYMRRRTEKSRVELRAEGHDQFEREQDGGWRRTIRGIETRVLEQAEGAFGASRPEFSGSERGRYFYSFKPSLPILDPTRAKRLTGVLELEASSGLPVRLYISDSAKSAEWELQLGRFNRAGTIDVPFEPAVTIEARPAERLNRADFQRSAATIARRLEVLGWEHRWRRASNGFILLLGQTKPRRQVDWLFGRGRVEVWQGSWVGAGESPAGAIEVGGDASRRVVLERQLAAQERIAAGVRATTPLAAVLVTSVSAPDSLQPALLVVDSVVLSTASPHPGRKLEFRDIGSEDDVRVIAALAGGAILPTDFAVTVRP